MLKTVWFARFREGLDPAVANQRWAEDHAQLMLRLPGVARYVQNVSVSVAASTGASEEKPPFDGFSAVWWLDRSSYLRALSSPEWKTVSEDASELFDTDWMRGMSAEIDERVMRVAMGAKPDGVSTPPPGPIKVIGVLRYRPGMRRDEANEHWVRTHGDLALSISEIGHYVQNHAARPLRGNEGTPLAFDGYSEAWLKDAETLERAVASPEWGRLSEDGPNLFDLSAILSATVEERVLRG